MRGQGQLSQRRGLTCWPAPLAGAAHAVESAPGQRQRPSSTRPHRPPPLSIAPSTSQVAKFAEAVPDNYRAYTYAALSLGGGALLGLALYGWAVWAP